MKTTFQKIRDNQPNPYSWWKLMSHHNPSSLNEEISIKGIIESNGLDDAIWALRTVEDTEALISLSIDVVESVLHVYEKCFSGDLRARDCIDACKKYIRMETSGCELIEKRNSAAASNIAFAAYAASVAYIAFAAQTARAAAQTARAAADANIAFAAAYTARAARAAAQTVYAAYNSDIGWEAIKDILLKY